jgi:hypothetical protein
VWEQLQPRFQIFEPGRYPVVTSDTLSQHARHAGWPSWALVVVPDPFALATPANVHDSQVLGDLLHGRKPGMVSAYTVKEAIRRHAPKAKDFTLQAHPHRPLSEKNERATDKSRARAR